MITDADDVESIRNSQSERGGSELSIETLENWSHSVIWPLGLVLFSSFRDHGETTDALTAIYFPLLFYFFLNINYKKEEKEKANKQTKEQKPLESFSLEDFWLPVDGMAFYRL